MFAQLSAGTVFIWKIYKYHKLLIIIQDRNLFQCESFAFDPQFHILKSHYQIFICDFHYQITGESETEMMALVNLM